jgi:flavin-binding protein dodecin
MSATTGYHILTVTGISSNSFDEAVKLALEYGYHNHENEFSEFVSYEVVKMSGDITMEQHGGHKHPVPSYHATIAISGVHSHHHEH